MRRPIFGNGIPRNIINADGDVTVLDTTQLDPKQTYALTLYQWIYGATGGGPILLPQLLVSTKTNGGPAIPIGLFRGFPTPPPETNYAPIKILDQYMVRGNQQVILNNQLATPYCFVWGYFEQSGEREGHMPFRGLQPSALVPPFSYPPAYYNFSVGQATQKLHQLNAAYIDVLTLDVWGPLVDSAFPVAAILFPGAGVITLPNKGERFAYRLLDGIPMRAPSSTDVDVTLSLNTGGNGMEGGAYGSFYRY